MKGYRSWEDRTENDYLLGDLDGTISSAIWEEGCLTSPESKHKKLCSVGLEVCASFWVVAKGGGGSCRWGEGGGLLLDFGKKERGC